MQPSGGRLVGEGMKAETMPEFAEHVLSAAMLPLRTWVLTCCEEAAKRERAACAEIAEKTCLRGDDPDEGAYEGGMRIAAAIRARGKA